MTTLGTKEAAAAFAASHRQPRKAAASVALRAGQAAALLVPPQPYSEDLW